MQKKFILGAIVLVLIVGGGAFYGGMTYGKQRALANLPAGRNFANRMNSQGMGQGWRGQNGGGFTAGTIMAKDDKSLTVKMRDGSTKIIFFSDTTQVGKAVPGSLTDLSNGQEVVVNGKTNADGSVTADNIQIRPSIP